MPSTGVCRVCGRVIYKRSKGWVHSDNRRVSSRPHKHYATPGGVAGKTQKKTSNKPSHTGAGGFNIFGF
jgi:hypothetical protein